MFSTSLRVWALTQAEDYAGTSPSNFGDSFRDPLADPASCKRDIPILKELNTNTIRVYAINPHSDHKECMRLLADAGIYVISDLSVPTHSIDRVNPSWGLNLYQRYINVVDEMSQFPNTIGFFAGNEVANSVTVTGAAAFVKAAVRDVKSYIRHKKYRTAVGYATNDDAQIRVDMANYFNCDKADDSVDFWGYNVYSWCGESSYETSGYKDRTEEFRNYSVPVLFAEYGCNAVWPRKFTEVDALYGDPMDQVWSGGIVYMYFQEMNDYGGQPSLFCFMTLIHLVQVWSRSSTSIRSRNWLTLVPTLNGLDERVQLESEKPGTPPRTLRCRPARPLMTSGRLRVPFRQRRTRSCASV